MRDVFISYRRLDGGWAGRLSDSLGQEIDAFFDDAIEPGDVFPDRLSEELRACRILLAIIGPGWLSAESLQRFSNPKDWVRQELETAFSRRIRVVPVLLDKALLPGSTALPATLQPLLQLDCFPLAHDSFKSDIRDLTTRLKRWLTGGGPSSEMAPTHLRFCATASRKKTTSSTQRLCHLPAGRALRAPLQTFEKIGAKGPTRANHYEIWFAPGTADRLVKAVRGAAPRSKK